MYRLTLVEAPALDKLARINGTCISRLTTVALVQDAEGISTKVELSALACSLTVHPSKVPNTITVYFSDLLGLRGGTTITELFPLEV